jgi:hypothetical protein
MPDLLHSLQGKDLGYLKIIARLWNIELNASDIHAALNSLISALLNRKLVAEIIETLPPDAQTAIEFLLENDSRVSWAAFCRRFGDIREMGAGKRDREQPYLSPITTTEILWYRGIIARAFLNVAGSPQEFAYIPDDLVPLLPAARHSEKLILGRPASPIECAKIIPATDHILDETCKLLSVLRSRQKLHPKSFEKNAIPAPILQKFLIAAKLIDSSGMPVLEPTRKFLEAERGAALLYLFQTWLNSTTFNELKMIAGLQCEGEWRNDARQARQTILELLTHIPVGTWWNITSFISAVREHCPDFQRPGGDYESWFIKQIETGEYLRGFASWDLVEGALIRYLITGPLHWLGIFDLASPNPETAPAAFRFSLWSADLMHERPPTGFKTEDGTIRCTADGKIILSPNLARAALYQIARFSEWIDEDHYRLTPASLKNARQQGLKISHILSLLNRYSEKPIPQVLTKALQQWDLQGVQAHIEQVVVLKLESPEILTALRESRAARFLGEVLNPTHVIIKPGAREKVIAALADLGYLPEENSEDGYRV